MKEEKESLAKNIWNMCLEGEKFLATFRNLIGFGVFLMLIAFSGIYLYALDEERQMAEKCGFTDGKLKCACTSDAWNYYIEHQENVLNISILEKSFSEYNNNNNNNSYLKNKE